MLRPCSVRLAEPSTWGDAPCVSSLGTVEKGGFTFPAQSPQIHPDWTGSGHVPTLTIAMARSALIGLGLNCVPRPHLGWGEGGLVPQVC